LDRNISKYVTQQVMTAAPATLVFMLYEKAIASLHEACNAMDKGEVEPRWRANNRTIEIISHLWSQLNMERGGEISKNLSELFPYMITRLADVDVYNDRSAAEEVISLLEPLRDAWGDLARTDLKTEGVAPKASNQATGRAPQVNATPARTRIAA